MRSLLFVPADSERKLARAPQSGADALILDLVYRRRRRIGPWRAVRPAISSSPAVPSRSAAM